MTLVDDFGRYDGRSKLLHAEVFGLRDDVKPQQTAAWRDELHGRDLIQLYTLDEKEYLQVCRWKERARSENSKFPAPPLRNPAESCGILPPSPSPSPSSSPVHPRHKSAPLLSAAGNSIPSEKDFIAQLKTLPAYKGIDLDREIGKMQAWLLTPKGRGRTLTKGFVVNWLNKVDAPLALEPKTKAELEYEDFKKRKAAKLQNETP